MVECLVTSGYPDGSWSGGQRFESRWRREFLENSEKYLRCDSSSIKGSLERYTKTVLLEVARDTIGSVKSQKKKKWISDDTYAVIMEKREAKGKDRNRYQELKAEVQKKLRVDKQQQLEGMCAKLEAANAKGNSRQVFQIVKSMARKFQPRLQCMQSATGKNLTEAAQSQTGGKGAQTLTFTSVTDRQTNIQTDKKLNVFGRPGGE